MPIAIAVGDLDGAAGDELAVISSGALYRLSADPAVDHFDALASADLTAPAAAAIVDGTLIVLHGTAADGMHVTAYDDTLATVGDVSLGFTATNEKAWIAPIAFPGGNARLVFAVGGKLVHFSLDEITSSASMVPEIPGPSGDWSDPETVAGFADSIAVAERDDAQTSAIPTAPPPSGQWAWTSIRSGTSWVGQVAVDLTGDGSAEVAGLDTTISPASLCALTPSTGAASNCLTTSIAAHGTVSTLATDVDGNGTDLFVYEEDTGGGHLTLLHDVTESGTTLSSHPSPPGLALDTGTRLAVGSAGLWSIAPDGTIACRTFVAPDLVTCE